MSHVREQGPRNALQEEAPVAESAAALPHGALLQRKIARRLQRRADGILSMPPAGATVT